MAGVGEVKAGKAFVELGVKDKTGAAFAKVGQQLDKLGTKVIAFGRKMLKYALIGSGGLSAMVGAMAQWAARLENVSAKTGLSTESLQALDYVAGITGTEFEVLQGAVSKMQRTILAFGQGSKQAAQGFGLLGLTLQDLQGLDPVSQFKLISQRINELPTPAQRAAAAMAIFGKTGAELIPTFQKVDQLISEFQAAGIALSSSDVSRLAELGDNLDRVGKVIKLTLAHGAAALADWFERDARLMMKAGKAAIEFVRNNRQLIVTLAKGTTVLMGLSVATMALGGGMRLIGNSVILATRTIVGLGAALTPVLAKMAAFAGAAFGQALAGSMAIAVGAIVRLKIALQGLGQLFIWFFTTNFAVVFVKLVIAAMLLVTAFSVIKSVVTSLGGVASQVFASIRNYLGEVWTELGKIGSYFVDQFGMIWDTLKQTFSRVVELIKEGNIQGAFDAALVGIETAWQQSLLFLEETWLRTVDALKEAFIGIRSVVKTTLADIRQQIAETLIKYPKLMELVTGVDVAGEEERRRKLNEQAASMGLAQTETVQQEMAGIIGDQFQGDRDAANAEAAAAQEARQSDLQARLEAIRAEREKLRQDLQAGLAAAGQQDLAPAVAPNEDQAQDIPIKPRDLREFIRKAAKEQTNAKEITANVTEGLEKGSAEAFKKSVENRTLALQGRQVGLLDDIKKLLKNQDQGKVVIEGVG